MGRLLIVSNRMPWNVAVAGDDDVSLTPASGGLANGLLPFHQRSEGRWIGWPGETWDLSAPQRAIVDQRLAALGMVPVHLSRDQIERFYYGFTNRVLWPLFHYLIDRVPVDAAGWESYQQVNQLFADEAVRQYQRGDAIWIHDFQLMLVPRMLRERLPEARIGFFLHIPFPSSEVFRTLPWRSAILQGLLGADVIGFHTYAYLRHFMASVLHIDGVEMDIDRVLIGGRQVQLGVFPMGVDAARFSSCAEMPDVADAAAAIRREAGGRAIILGIDRLDYTKGIPRRLEAIERLLAGSPELCDRVRYIQIAVPSREHVDSYQLFRRDVEERVGRINGSCATVRSTPIHYVHQSVSFQQLVALYRAADVMLVTPLRDGMNLVAKEFVACRPDGDGVLVLSEFAGAASELDGALLVNPYDVQGVASAIAAALAMPSVERRSRMSTMRRRVAQHDVHDWARAFLGTLAEDAIAEPAKLDVASSLMMSELRRARVGGIRLLLDYDGTLVPFAPRPELAAPDGELLLLLDRLTGADGIDVDIVSGRDRDSLERWFGHLPIRLWAEHGFWSRAGEGEWAADAVVRPDWIDRVAPILDQFTRGTPGAFVERKAASVAWHYRNAAVEFGARQANELRLLLGDTLRNQPFEVLEGRKVIEVRLRGISKSIVAEHLRRGSVAETIVAIGDDRTDEDLFRALPHDSITIAVGARASQARFCAHTFRDVRRLLAALVEMPRPLPPPVADNDGLPTALR